MAVSAMGVTYQNFMKPASTAPLNPQPLKAIPSSMRAFDVIISESIVRKVASTDAARSALIREIRMFSATFNRFGFVRRSSSKVYILLLVEVFKKSQSVVGCKFNQVRLEGKPHHPLALYLPWRRKHCDELPVSVFSL